MHTLPRYTERVRSLISFILQSLILVLILWIVGVASVTWYIRGPAPLTASLEQSGLYSDTAEMITGMMRQFLPPDPRVQPFVEALDAEITPAYLSFKVEHILDKGFAYAMRQTDELPSFSFSDLAQKLEERTPLFKTLPKEAREPLNKRYTLPEEQGEILRTVYSVIGATLWIPALLCGLLFLLLLPLRKKWPERRALIGKGLFLPGCIGLFSTGIVAALMLIIPQLPLAGFPPELLIRYIADSLLLLAGDIIEKLNFVQAFLYATLWGIGITFWKGRTMKRRWKIIHATAIFLLLSVSFANASLQKAGTTEWIHVDKTEGVSLKYQSDWIPFKTANIPNLSAQFYPKSAGFPRFPFYGLSIHIEDHGERPRTLKQYVDSSINEVRGFLTQVSIVERSDEDLAGIPGERILLDGKFAGVPHRALQHMILRDTKTYEIVYFMPESSFETYRGRAESMMESFKFKQ